MIEQTNYENATRSESTNPIELPKLPAANPSSSPNQQFDQKMSLSTRLNVIPAPTPEIQAQADQMTVGINHHKLILMRQRFLINWCR